MQHRVYISLGGNVGNVQSTIGDSLHDLVRTDMCQLERVSSLYKTPPWGNLTQADFLNACACLRTQLEPEHFLDILQDIELRHGRKRDIVWGPRTIDIDILLYGDFEAYHTARVTLPHPFMLQRAFVLKPLYEIAPNLVIMGRPISEYLKAVADLEKIELYVAGYKW